LEFNNSFNQMVVEWRRRQSNQARERKDAAARKKLRKQESHEKKQRERLQRAGAALSGGTPFQQEAYEEAVVRLSEAIIQLIRAGDRVTLSIPDSNVSEWLVQKSFRDQWGLQLSREQVHAVCMKLRGEDGSAAPAPTATTHQQSPVVNVRAKQLPDQSQTRLPPIGTRATQQHTSHHMPAGGSEESSSGGAGAAGGGYAGDVILGKHVKTLVVHLKNFIAPIKKQKKRCRQTS
jgi:hypothetical protein